jgi:alpha-beta hydrolase superfamily lysophospholipase
MDTRWDEDVLGPDYQVRTLRLAPDDEGEVVASLVRYAPPTGEPVRPSRGVLYVHGWSDYFFQTGLAEFWHARGVAFYALDLRKYGRSLREYQTPGYIEDLQTYDEEIDAAIAQMHQDLGRYAHLTFMGHSTGGLIAVLWAHRHPGAVRALVLNSPWLELQGSSVVRHVSSPAIAQLARFQPKTALPNIDPGYYARTLRSADGGEWAYDDRWRPIPAFPVRAGWLRAVIAGHARVARGLRIEAPILMLASARTLINPRWSEDMRSADVVLDVDLLARRAVQLGSVVTVVRIEGGVHDLTLSPRPARERFYAEISRWVIAYG